MSDNRIIRARARVKYKEMMKGTPKKKRAPFKDVFPMIKTMLLKKSDPVIKNSADEVEAEDQLLLGDMLAEMTIDPETTPIKD